MSKINIIKYSIFLSVIYAIFGSCMSEKCSFSRKLILDNKSKYNLVYIEKSWIPDKNYLKYVDEDMYIESDTSIALYIDKESTYNYPVYDLIYNLWNEKVSVRLSLNDTTLVEWVSDSVFKEYNRFNKLCDKYNFLCDDNWDLKLINNEDCHYEDEFIYTITDEMIEYWRTQRDSVK